MDTTDSSTVGCLTPTTGAEFSEASSVGFHTPTGTENEPADLSAADLEDRLKNLPEQKERENLLEQKERELFHHSMMAQCQGLAALLPLVYEDDDGLRPYIRDSILSVIVAKSSEDCLSDEHPFISAEVAEGFGQLMTSAREQHIEPEVQDIISKVGTSLMAIWSDYAQGRDFETLKKRLKMAKRQRDECEQCSFECTALRSGSEIAKRLGIPLGDENTSREGYSDSASPREVVLEDYNVTFALERPEWIIPSSWRLNCFHAGSVSIPGDFVVEGDFDVRDLSVAYDFTVGGNFEIKGDFWAGNSSMRSFHVGGRLFVGGTWVVERDFDVTFDWRVTEGSKVNGGFFVKGKYSVGSSYNTPPLGQLGQTQVTRRSR